MAILNVGSTRTYTTINSAYSVASHGDTLFIDEGTYNEKITMIGKLVNMVGNTAYPEKELVKIQAPNLTDYFTLWLEWNSTVSSTIYLEGLSIMTPVSSNSSPTAVYISGDGALRVSGMHIIFNKCTLRAGSSTSPTLVWGNGNSSGTYRTANSVTFKNCTLYIHTTYKHIFNQNPVIYWPNSSRVLNKCKLNLYFSGFSSGGLKYDIVPPYLDFIYISKNYTGYGPDYGVYSTTIENKYKFTGIIEENGIPVSRELRIFRSDNDTFVTSTVSSDTTGYYEAFVPFEVYHYIICMGDAAYPYYNDLIKAKCLPVEI